MQPRKQGQPHRKWKDAARERHKEKPMTETIDIPEVTDLDCAFPTRYRELLPKWEELTDQEKRMSGPYCDAVSSIFFSGGKLIDHGLKIKDGVDSKKVHRYIRATLGDFGPSHEHKIGGIAHMLAKWCEVAPKSR